MIFFMAIDEATKPTKVRQEQIDEALLAKIGEGDKAAFEALYLQTQRAVHAYVLSILKDPVITQDIVQDTYIKVRGAAYLYKPQGKPLAWIFTIAKHLSLSYLRQYRGNTVSDEEIPDNDIRFSEIRDTTDRLVLTAAMNILEESERQIIMLHIVSGVTHREIASALDMPISTVLSRYHRALKKLRKHLTERGAF